MSWRGLANRCMSPTSVANVTATIDAPQGLERLNNRRQGPGRHEFLDYTLQPLDPLVRDANALDHFLERNLMGRVIELLLLEPAQIAHRPPLLTRIDATVLEHESAHLLPMDAHVSTAAALARTRSRIAS